MEEPRRIGIPSIQMPRLSLFFLFFLLSCSPSEDSPQFTAAQFLAQLPASIFDNTTQGMSEPAKQQLLEQGKADGWEISQQTNRSIVVSQTDSGQSTVQLIVYAAPPDQLIAVHTQNGQNTTLDFWRYTAASQQLVQVGLSPSFFPQITGNDFLAAEEKLPDACRATIIYTMNEDGTISVEPYTWMESVFEERTIVYTIQLIWDGKKFQIRKSSIEG